MEVIILEKSSFLCVYLFFILALVLGINAVSAADIMAYQVVNASGTVESSIESSHTVPSTVNVGGNVVNASVYLKLSTATVLYLNNTSNSSGTFSFQNYGGPTSPSENVTTRNINKTEYLDIANRVNNYIDNNARAPNYASTSTGTIRFESLVYMYSQILSSYNINGVLPDYIIINPWVIVSNTSTSFVSMDQINNASARVETYIETNNRLPNYVTISGIQVTMPQFMGLSTTALLNIKANLNTSIVLKIFGNATDPLETLRSGNITSTEYLDIANRVKTYMGANGRAPNYASISLGNMRFESLIYSFSRILSSYATNNRTLPNYITISPWINSTSIIGSKTYGYVEKEFYGNQSSNQTIVLIIGVHPQENGIHTAISNALTNKSLDLTKRYVVYKVHVTQDTDDYSKGRMNGQLLAQEFIVPDVNVESPILVIDNHENHGADSGYTYYRFLYPISNTTATNNYTNQIIAQIPFLMVYYPPNPTSTQYVTVPIANQGIETIIYETYFYDSEAKKAADANSVLLALENLRKWTVNNIKAVNSNTDATVRFSLNGGSFNTVQTVSLTKNGNGTLYYTIDGSNPTSSETKVQYSIPIIIDKTTTLKVAFFDNDSKWSDVYSEFYAIDTVAPIVSVEPLNTIINSSTSIILKPNDDQDGNPSIYYTTDGSDPTKSETRLKYDLPIKIGPNTILKFYAVDGMGNPSAVYTKTYEIDDIAPIVNASVKGGTYYTPQNVVLAASEVSEIYYTLDSTIPTKESKKYTDPINIGTSKTLKFTVWDLAGNQSQIYAENYSIYRLEPYSYVVSVPYQQIRYKGKYQVAYTVKVNSGKYKVGKRWKYIYKYVTKYKWKKGWVTKWLYRNEVRWNNRLVLT